MKQFEDPISDDENAKRGDRVIAVLLTNGDKLVIRCDSFSTDMNGVLIVMQGWRGYYDQPLEDIRVGHVFAPGTWAHATYLSFLDGGMSGVECWEVKHD